MQPAVTIGVRRDGRTRWAVYRAVPLLDDESGAIRGAVATFLDVTEQKQAQAALRASEDKWRSLAQNVPDFVYVVDRSLRICSLNRVAKGFTEADTLGTPASAYVHADSRDEFIECLQSVFASGQPRRLECRAQGDDRALRWYEIYMGPLHGDCGVDEVILVARDVTDHRALLRRLAEKERLASVGMLAASVAHEINNPLTYVLANLEFALDHHRHDPPTRERALADARAGAERVRQIVRDLKVLAQPERDDLLFVDLRSVVEAAVRLAGPEVSHRASVTIALDGAPAVVGSESRLIRLFINLLVNAAHAIEERGDGRRRIEVAVGDCEQADLVAIEVRDDGTGIPPDRLGRIFDPFYTTKPAGAGTGLGLAICRDIAERAGGRIEVQSEIGRGATFTVWLPTCGAPKSRTAPRASEVEPSPMRVLVVDDDPLVLDALVRSLGDPHRISVARGGAQGLAALRDGDFDVVVCDLMMPDVCGLEVHRRACEDNPRLAGRFLFVTGGLVDAETSAHISAHGAMLLRKPFATGELAAAIAAIGQTEAARAS
jgi:PAS domain S-box-containing protein